MPHVDRKQVENHTSGPGSSGGQVQSLTPPATPLILQRAYADPSSLTPKDVKHLQRTIGNRAVVGLLSRSTGLQAKLKLGPADDPYEQEADRVAQQVVRKMAHPQPVQRMDEEEEIAQAKPFMSSSADLQRQDEPRSKMVFTKPDVGSIHPPKPSVATISRVQRTPTPQFKKSMFVQRQEEEDELQLKPLRQEMIQPKLAGAAAALRQQGGGLTGEVVAKKVFSIGIYKSTYEKILNAVAAYEKEEAKGKKSKTWFLSKLTAIENLCNNWLGGKGHKDELNSERALAIESLLDKIDQEKKSLGGSSSLLLIEEEDESSDEGSTTSSSTVSLTNPPWDQTQSCVAKGSGHGGVVIFDFGNGKLVVKNGLENEIYGARLAREMGLSSPETRKLSSDEVSLVTTKMKEFGATLPSGTPNLVLEYLPGITLGDVRERKSKLTKPEVYGVAASVGKWLVFDSIINEIDRFSAVRGGSDKKGINSGNFMLNPNNLSAGLTGIDQSAMTANEASKEAVSKILEKDFFFFLSVANGVLEQLGVSGFSSGFDPEEVAEVIEKSATEMVKSIGTSFNLDRVFELANDLEIKKEILQSIAKHITTIQG